MIKIAISIALLSACLGCATSPYRPHTATEKNLLASAIVGHSLDAVSTSYGVRHGMEEANGFWWDEKDTGSIYAVKAAMIGTFYIIGNFYPEKRSTLYKILAVFGYGPAMWNTYHILGD